MPSPGTNNIIISISVTITITINRLLLLINSTLFNATNDSSSTGDGSLAKMSLLVQTPNASGSGGLENLL